MAAIPIAPSSIAGAVPYTTTGQGIPIKLCNAPPASEGAKTIPMSFSFAQHTAFLVSFGNSPNPPISQLCSLYVDNTLSEHDVNILFPDTGYQVRIEAQGSRMIPVITGGNSGNQQLPSFYVVLDSSGVPGPDICNIQALNIFVPEFDAKSLQDTLSFGYGQFFIPQPTFTQSTSFSVPINFPVGTVFGGNRIIIPNNQWYITSININCAFTASGPDFFFLLLRDLGNNQVIANYVTSSIAASAFNILTDVAGLNIISNGGGGLRFEYASQNGTTWNGQLNINISGGVLVT